ncbi:MAG: bifunctional 5,10-methylenetetrahydrofolate dehydrogenase/5,10-methenyltetrahydrofolate cyclohydrolase [Acidobacteria bacterium]|nr:bifunctional 5,10-methylenetetrahydrofolate dehydrogenase/5,10-methenyltetrahydrofolate cyclohydrolase [Acidobacteriota bacterium]MCH8130881.1 bifunctional 5,10-methylenetetrahydrofolate dehydrogenase/5,10-methenyltetrahydrofolate cyclohydrolase [Acidobacteriota bacterium]
MSATILSGTETAAVVRSEVADRVATLGKAGKQVGLATILVGDDPPSQIYVRNKHRAAQKAGMISIDRHLPRTASQTDVERVIAELNADDQVDGMILQLPLPDGLDAEGAVETIQPTKDADGLHPFNLGLLVMGRPGPVPATPGGIMRILGHYDIATTGRTAVVVGRSFLVGRPMGLLLGQKGVDATVIQAHSRTRELAEVCRQADILVAAVGRSQMIDSDYVKPGATVIDVGINRDGEGLVGDVDFDAVVEIAGAITPVPGGVGPMTIASLLANTVALAEARA